MRAFTLDSFDAPPGLREDLPDPEAGPGRLLVRVQASSVNPVDALIAAGDRVVAGVPAMGPAVGQGAWAELVAVPAESAARLPDGVDLGLGQGDTVLVVGASGGVGAFAVQLAARGGAIMLAPGLPEDRDYLRGLGVTEALDRDGDVAYAAVVREGGRIASSVGAAGEGPGRPGAGGPHRPAHPQGKLAVTLP